MKRPITGFHQDEHSHWVAALSCGHHQHVRHDPPFVERLWVRGAEGRESRLGTALDCILCDRRELPAGFAPYHRTKTFTEATLPEALLSDHSTKVGVWGLIHVLRGEVGYRLHAPFGSDERIAPAAPGVVVPEVRHHLVRTGPVECYVEFWRAVEEAPATPPRGGARSRPRR